MDKPTPKQFEAEGKTFEEFFEALARWVVQDELSKRLAVEVAIDAKPPELAA